MDPLVFRRYSEIAAPFEELRNWHFRPGAFQRLNPPWEPARQISGPDKVEDGENFEIRVGPTPFALPWKGIYREIPNGFEDEQTRGPFSSWSHAHIFERLREQTSTLTDYIRYRLPFGSIGRLVGKPILERKLDRMFRYRHEITKKDLFSRHDAPPPRSLNLVVTGADGLVGSSLCPYLQTQGHRIFRVTSSPELQNELRWDLDRMKMEWPEETQIDGIVHLFGENAACSRWGQRKEEEILNKRIRGTRLLVEKIRSLQQPPSAFILASHIDHSQGEKTNSEGGPAANGFQADLLEKEKAELRSLEDESIRIVQARMGLVLAYHGGLLRYLARLASCGIIGMVGDGNNKIPWIAIDDVVDILHRLLFQDEFEGPVALTAPDPISQDSFIESLATTFHRSNILRYPENLARALFGRRLNETLLADRRMPCDELQGASYPFRYTNFDKALHHILGR